MEQSNEYLQPEDIDLTVDKKTSKRKKNSQIKGYQVAILMVISLIIGSVLTLTLMSSIVPGSEYDASVISALMESIDKY